MTRSKWLTQLSEQLGLSRTARFPIRRATPFTRFTPQPDGLEERVVPTITDLTITAITSTADTDGGTAKHVTVPGGAIVKVDFTYGKINTLTPNVVTLEIGAGGPPLVSSNINLGNATGSGSSSLSVTIPPGATIGTYNTLITDNEIFPFTTSDTVANSVDVVPRVTGVTSSKPDGAYKAGELIDIQVTFSNPVTVTGTPTLALNSGSGVTANFLSGSGTTTLTFRYTVAAGQNTQDLDYSSTSALSLNGGTIKSGSLNANLVLPTPGGAGSLGANKTIIIDTIAPTVDISPPSVPLTAHGPVSFTVTYSDLNFNTSTLSSGNITLNSTGTANATSVTVTGSGTTRTVTLDGITGDGTLGISIAAGTASDLAGNLAAAVGPSATFKVDNTAPLLSISAPSAMITKAGPVSYTVTYPDDVDPSTIILLPNKITLNSSGTANGTVAVMGTADPRSFIVSLFGITGDGPLGISIAAGTASDYAGNPAAAAGPSTTFQVDNTPVAVNISAPSASITAGGPVTYTVTYSDDDFASSTLTAADITLNKTGSANGTVSVDAGTGPVRTVTISGITGNGTLGISIAAGTASDTLGNLAVAAGPSGTFDVDNAPLAVNISAPSVPVTASGPVTYIIDYSHPNFASSSLTAADITLNKTGTANGTVTVDAGTGPIRTVTISGITGDGTLGISIAAGTAVDSVGNLAVAAGPSATFAVENTVPAVIISPPSASIVAGGPVTYTITYPAPFTASTLTAADVTLNKTGTANGTVSVDAGTGLVRTVTISGITGNGTLGISLAAGTAHDAVGNQAPAAGPSTTFQVDNAPLAVVISPPSVPITAGGPVTYTITYPDANFTSSSLKAADITLNKTGTANGIVSVVPGSGRVRTVTISGITGNGSLGISIAAGTAVDSVGNVATAAGPSTTFQVDNSLLSVVISPPSAPITAGGPITYTVLYPEANFSASTLSVADITLNKTGTANGTVSVDASSGRVRTVTISNTTGNGTLGISIAAGTATDSVGNVAGPAGPSTTFEVDNMALLVNISAPSAPITQGGPVTFTINYPDADFVSSTLSVADITLNKTGTANGTVSVDPGSGPTRTVTISNISGNGTLGISIAAGTATDSVGNVAGPAGPSTTFEVSNVALFAVGNSGGTVRIVNANTGGTISTVRPLDSTVGAYTGLVEVALGDFNGDGIADLAVSAADPLGLHGLVASKAGKVFVYDGAVLGAGKLSLIHTFTPFATTDGPGGAKGAYTNGLNIAAGDVNGDGHIDLIAGTRGVTADVGTPEYGRLVVISEGAASDGSGDMILGGIITPFGATYQKGVVVAAGNLDGVGGDEIGVTRGGPVAASNPNKSIKLKAFKFTGGALVELDLSGSTQPLAPFPAIQRDGRVAFVDPNGDGKQQLVFSALDRTDPTNTQVRIAVFDVNTSTGLATPVSTGTGPSQSYTVGDHIQDHAITQVDLSEDGSSDLALITENSAAGALSGVMYLAPFTGATLPGGFSISLTTGGVAIDGV